MLHEKYSIATGIDLKYYFKTQMVFLLIFTYSLAKSLEIAWSPFNNSDKAAFKILTHYLKTLCSPYVS